MLTGGARSYIVLSYFINACQTDDDMDCLNGKSEHKAKPGRYRCRQCGAVSKKKGHVCEPKKIKESHGKGKRSTG
jgi:hypothetical protein